MIVWMYHKLKKKFWYHNSSPLMSPFLKFYCQVKTHTLSCLLPRNQPTIPVTYVSAPLEVGEVHVRNEQDGLSVKINKWLENCDVHSLVRENWWHFHVGN